MLGAAEARDFRYAVCDTFNAIRLGAAEARDLRYGEVLIFIVLFVCGSLPDGEGEVGL